jgi:hypothetical protein
MTKLVVKDHKIVKVDSELQVAQFKVICTACTFILAWDEAYHDKVMEAGASLEDLRRSVREYVALVKEDEERRGVERS